MAIVFLVDSANVCCIFLGMRREGTTVLNIFNDYDYNRSVITIVASIDLISKFTITVWGIRQPVQNVFL